MTAPRSPGDLFRIIFAVHLAPEHPRYYDCEFGWLSVWLFDQSAEVATIRAKNILDQLPYEVVRFVSAGIDKAEPKAAPMVAGEESAKCIGIAFFLYAAIPGSDESKFRDFASD